MDIAQSSNRIINRFPPLNNITPFTRVDGWSFLEVLEGLRRYIVEILVKEIDERNEEITEQLNEWFDDYTKDFADLKLEWQTLFDEFMSDIVNQLEGLNDQAVANLVNNPESLLRNALDNHYGHVVDIRSHGGQAVAGFDNQPALQACMNEIEEKGGGTIAIPFADVPYEFGSGTRLVSNLEINLHGSTLKLTDNHTYNGIFKITSQGAQGYGSGARNVSIRNGIIQGNFERGTFIGFSVHHVENFQMVDIVFDQAIGNGHSIDLMGCKDVTLRRCIFRGRMAVEGRNYVEAVQVDHSTRGGAGSSLDELLSSYDGLPTVNVLMEDCHSESLVVNNAFYFAPRLIGSHSRVADILHKNITIRDCSISDSGNTTTDGRYLGWIHFTHTDGLLIDGLTLNNTRGDSAVAVGLWGVDTTYPLSSVQQPSPPLNTDAGSVSSKNVTIKNVKAYGFKSSVLAPLIRLHGSNVTSYIENVIVDGVQITDGHSGGAPSEGVYVVSGAYADNVTVSNISVGKVSRAVSFEQSKTVTVDKVSVSKWCSVAVRLIGCVDMVVSNIISKGNNSMNISDGSSLAVSNIRHTVVDSTSAIEYAACLGVTAVSDLNLVNISLTGQVGSVHEFGLRLYGNSTNGNVDNVIISGFPADYNDPNSINIELTNIVASSIQRSNAWVDLTLPPTMIPQPNFFPKVRKLTRTRVEYEGGVTSAGFTGTADALVGTVPVGYRPVRTQYFTTVSNGEIVSRGRVEPSGALYFRRISAETYILANTTWMTN